MEDGRILSCFFRWGGNSFHRGQGQTTEAQGVATIHHLVIFYHFSATWRNLKDVAEASPRGLGWFEAVDLSKGAEKGSEMVSDEDIVFLKAFVVSFPFLSNRFLTIFLPPKRSQWFFNHMLVWAVGGVQPHKNSSNLIDLHTQSSALVLFCQVSSWYILHPHQWLIAINSIVSIKKAHSGDFDQCALLQY